MTAQIEEVRFNLPHIDWPPTCMGRPMACR